MIKVNTYKLVKENASTGERAKRTVNYFTSDELNINGLYLHLGSGLKGAYRVLELKESNLVEC